MSVVENIKQLADQARSAGQFELYKQISEAEDAVREIAREKRRLEDRVDELERALRFKEEVAYRAPLYYLKQGDQTPYCARCWEKDRHAVHVVVQWSEQGETRWDCPDCKTPYITGRPRSTPSYNEPDPVGGE